MRGKAVYEGSALKRRGGRECGWERGGEHSQVEAVVGALRAEVAAFAGMAQVSVTAVQAWGDNPISRLNYWSPRTTQCPKAYHHMVIAAGQTAVHRPRLSTEFES